MVSSLKLELSRPLIYFFYSCFLVVEEKLRLPKEDLPRWWHIVALSGALVSEQHIVNLF